MVYSMTGYGRCSNLIQGKRITAEAKSLNSKQLDLSLRMPSRFREVEMAVRENVSKVLERGKVEINVYVEYVDSESAVTDISADINIPVAMVLKEKVENASNILQIPLPLDWYQVLLRFPEVMHTDRPYPIADKDECEAMVKVLEECVAGLMNYRKTEGEKLESFLLKRVENIEELLAAVGKYEQQRIDRIKEKIADGLKKLSQIDIDNNRLEQELIFYIEKLDVSEEKQRLQQHLDYFKETLQQNKPGQGKKLGFIAQEMGREINTLGSKSNHAELQKIVVRMKDELEQIKEQVLNVM